MRTVPETDAGEHLSRLLDEVELGEMVVITRQGLPVARLIPERSERSVPDSNVIDEIRAFRRTIPRISLDEIRSARHDGHRY